MATQMQLEVILTGVLWRIDNKTVDKDENGKRKLFLYTCCLKS